MSATPIQDEQLGRTLLAIARNAIGTHLGFKFDATPAHEALQRAGATFVTLFTAGELHGCIGSLEARRPLVIDVHENALGAAFWDARFDALRAEEFSDTSIEVSLLSPSEELDASDERALLRQLQPGVDGVTIAFRGRRATFLPQVWRALPEPEEFLAALKQKAELPRHFWSPKLNVTRYRVTQWREHEPWMKERL